MGRRRQAEVRELPPDIVYGDVLVTAFINKIMRRGSKSLANGVFYGACQLIKEKTSQEPLAVFHKAVENVRPRMEVRSRRIGGQNVQVPYEVRPRRQQHLALAWLRDASASRPEATAVQRIAGELLDASQGKGGAVKKREDAQKMADASRAYAHYRW